MVIFELCTKLIVRHNFFFVHSILIVQFSWDFLSYYMIDFECYRKNYRTLGSSISYVSTIRESGGEVQENLTKSNVMGWHGYQLVVPDFFDTYEHCNWFDLFFWDFERMFKNLTKKKTAVVINGRSLEQKVQTICGYSGK